MLRVLTFPKDINFSSHSTDAVEFSYDEPFLLVSGRGIGTLIFNATRLLQESPTLLQSLPYETSYLYDVDFSRGDDQLLALLERDTKVMQYY